MRIIRSAAPTCGLKKLFQWPILLMLLLLISACQDDEGGSSLPTPQPIVDANDTTRVLVPAGYVVLGNNPDGWGNYALAAGEDTVYIDSFYIDRYEVSNLQYAAYLNSAMDSGLVNYTNGDVWETASGNLLIKTSSAESGVIWVDTLAAFAAADGYAELPAVMVSWHGADAFATFYGERLPSENEWEKAARGDVNALGTVSGVGVGYPYPWGEATPHQDLANFGSPTGSAAEAVSYPQGMSWFGAFNMAGNVWEWTATIQGSTRVRRGGGFASTAGDIRTAARFFSDPMTTDRTFGFRCAANP